jgi:hypothetical protein
MNYSRRYYNHILKQQEKEKEDIELYNSILKVLGFSTEVFYALRCDERSIVIKKKDNVYFSIELTFQNNRHYQDRTEFSIMIRNHNDCSEYLYNEERKKVFKDIKELEFLFSYEKNKNDFNLRTERYVVGQQKLDANYDQFLDKLKKEEFYSNISIENAQKKYHSFLSFSYSSKENSYHSRYILTLSYIYKYFSIMLDREDFNFLLRINEDILCTEIWVDKENKHPLISFLNFDINGRLTKNSKDLIELNLLSK